MSGQNRTGQTAAEGGRRRDETLWQPQFSRKKVQKGELFFRGKTVRSVVVVAQWNGTGFESLERWRSNPADVQA